MKDNILKVILALLFLVAFNLLFFLLTGVEHTDTQWVCYGFIHGAYAFLLLTPLFARFKKGEAVLSGSLWLRALAYFFLELLVGCGLLIWSHYQFLPVLWPAIAQTVLCFCFLVMQLLSVLANSATTQSLDKQRRERVYIRSLAEQLKDAMRGMNNSALRKQVAPVQESLARSSIESFPEAAAVEQDLADAVGSLCLYIEQGNEEQITAQINNVKRLIQQRNQAIRAARRN